MYKIEREVKRVEKKKKKILAIVFAVVALVVVGTTYAFINQTLSGSKKVTITAGTLSLVLNEGNAITISDALPMYDQVGMIQEKSFDFSLANNTSNDTEYVLKLVKIASANELSPSIVKYYLTKEGVGEPALLSSLTDGVIDTGTIEGNDTIDYTLRLWIDSSVTSNEAISGKSLSYRIDVEASMIEESSNKTVTFAGITKEVNETPDGMFNYTSEGCMMNFSTFEQTCPVDATNGIYAMEDDDNLSYFYRGKVDNLVKFGSYTKDYYVYRYLDDDISYDFVTLEACKVVYNNCSEENKVLKYAAKDNIPMYWRIVRVNGDGTIRMVYSGTTPDAKEYDAGIGVTYYNDMYDNPKYTGYSYDRQTLEVNSLVKDEIDTWYSNSLNETMYDSDIVIGKFCSDSSGYEETTDILGGMLNRFSSVRRNFPEIFNLTMNSLPIFRCPVTTESYGGNYNLKVGLMTLDEIVAAGGQMLTTNPSVYLNNGSAESMHEVYFWTMTPAEKDDGYIEYVGAFHSIESASSLNIHEMGLIRPVINLRADVVFKKGTDGSVTAPYEVE